MIYTTSATITFKKILKLGTVTTYSGNSANLHISIKNKSTETIVTEASGNAFTIVDSTVDTDGYISVDVAIELGSNRLSLFYADNIDLDAGSVGISKLGSGLVKRTENDLILEV